jgi:hypothetical protein
MSLYSLSRLSPFNKRWGEYNRAEEALSDRMDEMAHHKRQTAALLMKNALANIGRQAAVSPSERNLRPLALT